MHYKRTKNYRLRRDVTIDMYTILSVEKVKIPQPKYLFLNKDIYQNLIVNLLHVPETKIHLRHHVRNM